MSTTQMIPCMLCATAKAEAASNTPDTVAGLKTEILTQFDLLDVEQEPMFFVCGDNCENVTTLKTDHDLPKDGDVVVVLSDSDKQSPETLRTQVLEDCTELRTADGNVDLLKQVEFEEADMCSFCKDPKPFTWGVLGYGANLRHHCRECGKSACDDCASHYIPLPLRGLTDPQRVCDACFRANPGVEAQPLLEDDLALAIGFGDTVAKYHQHAAHIADAARIQHTVINAAIDEIENQKTSIQTSTSRLQTQREVVKKTALTMKIAEADEAPQQAEASIEQSSIQHSYHSPKLSKLQQEFHKKSAEVYNNDGECETLITKVTDHADQLRQYQQKQRLSEADLDGTRNKDAIVTDIREQFKLLSGGMEFQDKLIESFRNRKEAAETLRSENPGRDSLEDYLSLEQKAKHDNERDLLVGKQQTLKVAMLKILKASEELNRIALTKAKEIQPLVCSSEALLSDIEAAIEKTKALDNALLEIGARHDKLLDQCFRNGTMQYGNIYHQLNQQINRLKIQVKKLTEENGALKAENDVLKDKMLQSGDQVAQATISSLSTQLQVSLKTITTTRDEKKELDKQVQNLTAQVKSLNVSVQGKDQEIKNTRETLEELRAEISAQQAAIATKQNELEQSAANGASDNAEHQQLAQELEQMKSENATSEAQILQLQGAINELQQATVEIESGKSDLLAEIDELTAKAKKYRERNSAAESRVVEYHEALHSILESVHPTGHVDYPLVHDSPLIQEAKDGVNSFVSRYGTLELENMRLKQQATNLTAEISAMGGGPAGVPDASPVDATAATDDATDEYADKIAQVVRMGFVDTEAIRQALIDNNGNVGNAVTALLA